MVFLSALLGALAGGAFRPFRVLGGGGSGREAMFYRRLDDKDT